MQSQPRSKRPPRTPWPRWAAGLAALLLSGAACADMVGGLLVSPTSLNFGSVALGATSASQQVTVTNTTSAPIGPLSVGSGVSAPWGSGTGCSGVTLAAGTSCSSTYTFTPTALGPQELRRGHHDQWREGADELRRHWCAGFTGHTHQL